MHNLVLILAVLTGAACVVGFVTEWIETTRRIAARRQVEWDNHVNDALDVVFLDQNRNARWY